VKHGIVALSLMLAVAGCGPELAPAPVQPVTEPSAARGLVQIANPASQNCLEKGGRRMAESRPDGGEFGVCYFEDNHQCEEWALFRGECPQGGRRITGYTTQAGRWCAITGGQYTDVTGNDAADERGNCILPGGNKCEAEAYWRGSCGR
jgi:putative hemolysin